MTRRSHLLVAALLAACASGCGVGAPGSGVPEAGPSSFPDQTSGVDAGASRDGTAKESGGAEAAAGVTTLRVHYPAGAHALALRGSNPPYDWNKGVPLTLVGNDTWVLSTSNIQAPLQWKPLLDDATWSQGPNYLVSPGATVDVYPHFTSTAGSYSLAFQFTSAILGNARGVWIYLPPSYLENTDASFPVLYMHDGQNLFDPAASFSGVVWQIDTAMNAGAADGSIAEAIVVGAENTANRIAEYTPVVDPTVDAGGALGPEYVRMLVEELKPKIDATYRTIPDRDHTAMMGSSLGGLITSYAGVERSDVYGAVGALSPSTWWDSDWLLGEVATVPSHATRAARVYVDSGDSGPSNDDVADTAKLAAAYQGVGYVEGMTLDYWVQSGGQHSETYWAQRAPKALAFVLGARPYLP